VDVDAEARLTSRNGWLLIVFGTPLLPFYQNITLADQGYAGVLHSSSATLV
jgi:hypothetical protein